MQPAAEKQEGDKEKKLFQGSLRRGTHSAEVDLRHGLQTATKNLHTSESKKPVEIKASIAVPNGRRVTATAIYERKLHSPSNIRKDSLLANIELIFKTNSVEMEKDGPSTVNNCA